MQLPTLSLPMPSLSLSFFINTPVLVGILVVFLLAYSVISFIIMYHWSAYGMKSPGILLAKSLFLIVSLIMFIVAGLGIYYFKF